MRRAWNFIQIKRNRDILAWIGGGVVVAAGGIFAAVTFLWPPNERPSSDGPATHVEASEGAIAIGGDVRNSEVRTGSPSQRTPEAVR
jgi:hypothetical protein